MSSGGRLAGCGKGLVLVVSTAALTSMTSLLVTLHWTVQSNLLQMTALGARGMLLQTEQTAASTAATLSQEQAALEQETSEAALAEAQQLEQASAADAAAAAAQETEAVSWQAEAAAAEETADAAWLEAAVLQEALEVETTEATQATEAAAVDAVEAQLDEDAVLLCQGLPGVSVVCDVMGGLAAVALDRAAVLEAAVAAAALGAAVETRVQEGEETSVAVTQQAAAVQDQAAAATAEQKSTVLEEEAQEEAAQAVAEEAVAEEEAAKSVADEAEATKWEAEAAEKEKAAARAFADSLWHGIAAVWYSFAESLLAVCMVIVLSLRLFLQLQYACTVPRIFMPSVSKSRDEIVWQSTWWAPISFVWHYVVCLMVTCLALGPLPDSTRIQWTSLLDLKRLGGALLRVIFITALSQVTLMHGVPLVLKQCGSWWWYGRPRMGTTTTTKTRKRSVEHILFACASLVVLVLWNLLGVFAALSIPMDYYESLRRPAIVVFMTLGTMTFVAHMFMVLPRQTVCRAVDAAPTRIPEGSPLLMLRETQGTWYTGAPPLQLFSKTQCRSSDSLSALTNEDQTFHNDDYEEEDDSNPDRWYIVGLMMESWLLCFTVWLLWGCWWQGTHVLSPIFPKAWSALGKYCMAHEHALVELLILLFLCAFVGTLWVCYRKRPLLRQCA